MTARKQIRFVTYHISRPWTGDTIVDVRTEAVRSPAFSRPQPIPKRMKGPWSANCSVHVPHGNPPRREKDEDGGEREAVKRECPAG